jgi:small basic protein
VKLRSLRRDDWVVGGLALALTVALLFFPWFDLSAAAPIACSFVSCTLTATQSPDGWTAVFAVLALLALIADLAIDRLSPQTALPIIGTSRESTRFGLACAAAVFTALKFLLDIHFSLFGWGFYVSIVLAAALVYAARQLSRGLPIVPSRR